MFRTTATRGRSDSTASSWNDETSSTAASSGSPTSDEGRASDVSRRPGPQPAGAQHRLDQARGRALSVGPRHAPRWARAAPAPPARCRPRRAARGPRSGSAEPRGSEPRGRSRRDPGEAPPVRTSTRRARSSSASGSGKLASGRSSKTTTRAPRSAQKTRRAAARDAEADDEHVTPAQLVLQVDPTGVRHASFSRAQLCPHGVAVPVEHALSFAFAHRSFRDDSATSPRMIETIQKRTTIFCSGHPSFS